MTLTALTNDLSLFLTKLPPMKKILFLACIVFAFTVKAQFVFEHDYDSAATWNVASSRGSQLMIIKFEVSGEHYVKINRAGKALLVYDLNHSLVKNISLANCPIGTGYFLGDFLYLSEQLFNTDSQMEFMYCYPFTDSQGNGQYVTNVYNESGAILFTDTAWPAIRPNYEQQQYPIYNTSQGTKMILSCFNGHAKVYGLSGTLTTSIQIANNNLIPASNFVSNPLPNPTNQNTTIDYKLPDSANQGEIVFYNQQGTEIKRFKVDRTFDSLLISTTDIPAGTYFYQLLTGSNVITGKKLVVIK